MQDITSHNRALLTEAAAQRILILDGAMGTMVQGYKLTEEDFHGECFADMPQQLKGNNDVLVMTQPDVIADIHRRYLKAGADIIETNTFSAQRISQADYHLEDYCHEINLKAARIARQCADEFSTDEKPRYVAGSIGPTNKTASMSPDVNDPAYRDITYDELFTAYKEQTDALLEGGVDAFLIETIFDTLNCKAAIDAAMSSMQDLQRRVPLMLSVTVSDMAGRTLSGQTLEAFLSTMSSYDIFSVGLNCSLGAREMKPFLKQLAARAPYYISCYPNAGLPNEMGQYNETALSMTPQIEEFMAEGLVNIIGGCCGTDDSFIKAYAEIAPNHKPRKKPVRYRQLHLSGLESVSIPVQEELEVSGSAFCNVGERCNVAGSRKFLRLINEKKYDEALSIARKQVEDGALVIDINMDDGLLDAKKEMVHFVNLIASEPDIARVPLMIDSSKWEVIETALKCIQGKCIVNSISLKEGEEVFLSHARTLKRFGVACVVMCFDEIGQATTYERRIEIAGRAYHLLTEVVGMPAEDIIFDPNILSIATGMEEHGSYAVDFIRATEWIRKNCPGAHVSGGVSNLSFSFRGNNYIREAMHCVFLYHAMQNGMDFAIVNPASKVAYGDIPEHELELLEDVILNRRKGAADDLTEYAQELKARQDAAKAEGGVAVVNTEEAEWRKEDVDHRLAYALRKGIGDYLSADIDEALKKYSRAVDIIEGPLMEGMNQVGKLFGEGKMFLPQVVKTARTMKQAVQILMPYMEDGATGHAKKAGKIVIATVKGDVHDIGKNIVSVVLSCNNFEMIDLGVMVPTEKIVETAIEQKADAVCLSGLITPSLDEMVAVAREMEKAELDIPLIVGGATTSELHAALKIVPEYHGPVVWMKDAAQNVVAASRLLNAGERNAYVDEINARYELLRQEYAQKQESLMGIEEARKNKLNLFK